MRQSFSENCRLWTRKRKYGCDETAALDKKILAYRRKKRVEFLLSKVNVKSGMKILDIGCGIDGRSFEDYLPEDYQITGIDLNDKSRIATRHPNFVYVQQDAQDLSQFGDQSFDLAVSIGMLEHITDNVVFRRIASEVMRVARQYIIVVPYKYAWLEPHFVIPLFPILPYGMKLWLVKSFNLCGMRSAVIHDPDIVRKNYRWLSNAEYRGIFPDSKTFLLPTLETVAIIKRAAA
ncbi:MAG: class I SAM-dependent methyltransferase [Candidatus Sumerlaeota bacterium]|nr:class I SAM-dependent methyltransferase [Candidatus Sumerlaeota bacterium]